MAFAVVNLLVALTLNPWRTDRLPDRFPAIVQDTLLILLFGVVATLILRDRMLATTAVGAVVLGSRVAGHAGQSVRRPGDSDREAVPRRRLGDDRG